MASLFQNADDASQGKTHRSLTAERESILRLLISCEIYSLAENDTYTRKVDTLPEPLMDEVLAKVATLFE